MPFVSQFVKRGLRYPVRALEGRNQLFGVAAPLLAGFSLSLIGVLAQLPENSGVRWKDWAFLILLLAGLLYLGSMHFALNAAHLRVSDDQLKEVCDSNAQYEALKAAYRHAHEEDDVRASAAFTVACTLLIGGVTVILVPAGPWSQISVPRVAALSLAGLAVLTQLSRNLLGLLGSSWVRPVWLRELLVPQSRIGRITCEDKGES